MRQLHADILSRHPDVCAQRNRPSHHCEANEDSSERARAGLGHDCNAPPRQIGRDHDADERRTAFLAEPRDQRGERRTLVVAEVEADRWDRRR